VRALLTLAVGLVLCARVMADIVPGTLDVKAAFEKSDLVCNCFVRSIAIMEERSIVNRPGVSIIRRRMRANVEIKDLYKSREPNGQSIVVEYVRDIPNMSASQPGLSVGEKALLFLKATGPATYMFADPFLGATPFSSLPRQTGKLGLAKLESALVGASLLGNQYNRSNALRLLQGFESLDQASFARIVPLSTSKDPEIAFSALAILLKTRTPESVERLKRYLDGYKGDEPIAVQSIGTELGRIRDVRALPAIEVLSRAKFVPVRYGAMDAMRGMKSRQSAPTLVQRLDYPDSLVQYLAVITLAEIFGKYEDYAPSMYLFDKNPRRYIDLWKKWWAEQGHNY